LFTVIVTLDVAFEHTASVESADNVRIAEPAVASTLPGVYVGFNEDELLNVPLPFVVHASDE
jgi:hypothetical protein